MSRPRRKPVAALLDTPPAAPPVSAPPRWDLGQLYSGPDAPELKRDLARAQLMARGIAARWRGKVESLSGAELAEALTAFDDFQSVVGRPGTYAYLRACLAVTDPAATAFESEIDERIAGIRSIARFLTGEINALDDKTLADKLAAPEMARFIPWVTDMRAGRQHLLGAAVESYAADKYVTGVAEWRRLYEEQLAGLTYPLEGKELSGAEIQELLKSTDAETRKKAFAAQAAGRRRALPMLTRITNILAKDKLIEDRWRNYPRPDSQRNRWNEVEDEVVDALAEAVHGGAPTVVHRYNAIKARWMAELKAVADALKGKSPPAGLMGAGAPVLDAADRDAPPVLGKLRNFTWDEAREIVQAAYDNFHPELGAIVRQFFDKGWIDAEPRDGKRGGAFCNSSTVDNHPWVLVNFNGTLGSLRTLGHELGHAVHQYLSRDHGELLHGMPLTIQETASIMGEHLVYEELERRANTSTMKRAILAERIENQISTIFNQIALYDLELATHKARARGELSPQALCDMWKDIRGKLDGPGVKGADETWWAFVPHRIRSPFYVYAYAFGGLTANALFDAWKKDPKGFPDRYVAFLKAGATQRHTGLLAPFGLDASKPAHWQAGLGVLTGLIDRAESMKLPAPKPQTPESKAPDGAQPPAEPPARPPAARRRMPGAWR